ncbi:MAG: hypothetical protein II299_05425 [Alistipes sp.]|nr:hypothetical protein [Alistipes sp.]
MKRFFTLIFLLLFALQSFGQQRIRVTDFGAKPGSGEDTRHAFQRAVIAEMLCLRILRSITP